MNRKKKVFSVLGLVLLMMLVAVMVAFSTRPTTAQTPVKHIKIGGIMPISGPLSVPSIAFNRGWGFYSDKLKEQGGIKIGNDRYVFDFIYEDSKGAAETAGTAANKLVTQDKVKYVIGAMLEPEVQAIYQVTAPAKVLYAMGNINIPGHPVDIGPNKPLLVRLAVGPDDNQAPDLDYLMKTYPGAKNIAAVAPNIGYEGMIEALKTQAAERGLKVSLVEMWEWGTTDFVPTYTRVLASKPDVVFAMNSGQATYQLMGARQLGFKGPFISNSPLGADVFVNVVNDPIALTDVLVNSPDIYHPTDVIQDLMRRWKEKYGSEPFVSDCIHPYDMPWILAQAMEKAQSLDPEKVLATLDTMTAPGSLKVNFGLGHMGGKKRFGVNRALYRPYPLTRIMNGKTEFVGFLPIPKE
jgi:branched-chain amino acid transport system substrate-binding protein